KKVISNPIGKFRNRIGRRRRNKEKIDRLREGDVRDRIRVLRREIIDNNVRTRDRAKSKWLNKLTSVPRHADSDGTIRSLQAAQDLDRLVSGNPAGNAQRNSLSLILSSAFRDVI